MNRNQRGFGCDAIRLDLPVASNPESNRRGLARQRREWWRKNKGKVACGIILLILALSVVAWATISLLWPYQP